MSIKNHGGGRRPGRFQEHKTSEERRPLVVRISTAWHDRLDAIANLRGVAKSQLVRAAIRRFLESPDG